MEDRSGALCIGVDVGATNTRAALVDQRARLLTSAQRPTVRGDREGILQGLLAAIEEVLAGSGVSQGRITGIGVGIVGAVDIRTGRTIRSTNLGARDIPVRPAVRERFDLPCWTVLRQRWPTG